MRTANDPGMTGNTIPPRFGVKELVVPSGERRRGHQRRESGKTREMFGEIRLDEIPSFRFGFFAVAGEILQRNFNLDGCIPDPLVSHQKPGISWADISGRPRRVGPAGHNRGRSPKDSRRSRIRGGQKSSAHASKRRTPGGAGPGRLPWLAWAVLRNGNNRRGEYDLRWCMQSFIFHLLKSRHPGTVVQVGFDVRRQGLTIAASTNKECDRRFVRVRS